MKWSNVPAASTVFWFTFQENNLRASRADSIVLSDVACIPQTLPPTIASVSQDKVDVAKKGKPKTSKIRTESQTVDGKQKSGKVEEKLLPQIAVSTYDDGKLARSLSAYN